MDISSIRHSGRVAGFHKVTSLCGSIASGILSASLIGSCLLLASCGEPAESAEERPHLPVTTPLRRDISLSRDYVAQIRAIQHIELRALERGYLESIYVDEGQTVKAGQVMFEIMPRLNRAELQKTEAEAEFREIEYQNTERLTKTKISAPSELALAKANLDKAIAERALARLHLELTQIKAPFDGIMGRFAVRKGSLVQEGELLTTLSDNHEMWVYFNMPEAEYLQIDRRNAAVDRMKARLQMANGSFYPHGGEVTAIEADFNNETGNIAFRATFPNPDGMLRHGQTGRVILDTEVKDAILIPQKAAFDSLDKRFVFLVDDAGRVRSKEIEVNAQIPDIFLLRNGLESSDKILLEGQRKVNEGDTIVPVVQDPSKVLANLKAYAE